MANAVCNDCLPYPGSSIGRVQGLGSSECLVGQLKTRCGEEECKIHYCIQKTTTHCFTDNSTYNVDVRVDSKSGQQGTLISSVTIMPGVYAATHSCLLSKKYTYTQVNEN